MSSLWIALVCGAVVTGASLVGVLVSRRGTEPIYLLLGLGSFTMSCFAYLRIAEGYGRFDALFYGFAFLFAGIGGGWALASSLLDRLAPRPAKPRHPRAVSAPSADRVAVVVVSCIEPSAYDPRATAAMLQSLVDEGLLETSLSTAPFLFLAQKARYRAIGGMSPAHGELRRLAEALGEVLARGGIDHVAWAACGGAESLPRIASSIAQAGYGRIVVAEVSVGDSLHMAEVKRETDALRLETLGVRISYTDAFSSAERIVGMLVERIMNAVDDIESTGVVLVGHGQPESRARRNPGMDEAETALLSRTRLMVVERGIPEANVRIAWSEWSEPEVTSTVRHLAALGCRRVVVVPAVFPLDTMSTRLDLEMAVRQARVSQEVVTITLPAWRDDPAVVEELRERVMRSLEEG